MMVALATSVRAGSDEGSALLLLMRNVASVESVIPTTGLIAEYKFDGGSLDSSFGGAQTLTNKISGTVAQFTTGKSGDGLYFVPTNQPIFVSTFSPTTYQYTVIGWQNWMEGGNSDDNAAWSITKPGATTTYLGLDAVDDGVAPNYTNYYPRLLHRATTSRFAQNTASLHTSNVWLHVAIVSSSPTSGVLYVNGVEIASHSTSAGTGLSNQAPNSLQVCIGHIIDTGGASTRWMGILDTIRFYNVALASNTIKQIYDHEL